MSYEDRPKNHEVMLITQVKKHCILTIFSTIVATIVQAACQLNAKLLAPSQILMSCEFEVLNCYRSTMENERCNLNDAIVNETNVVLQCCQSLSRKNEGEE